MGPGGGEVGGIGYPSIPIFEGVKVKQNRGIFIISDSCLMVWGGEGEL